MAGTDLQRTWGTPTDAKKYTLSLWLKRCNSGSIDWIMNTAGDFTNINFRADDTLEWGEYTSGVTMKLVTDRKFRDPGAWYHLVFAYDSTTSAGDRQRMYVNGVEETSFSTDTNSALNYSSVMNSAVLHSLGSQKAEGYANYSNVVMAHVHFTDGTAYAPTAFGETDSTSGIWVPKTGPSVTYGDNGFFLKFASGAEGTDSSGEGNNWTVSNGTLTQTKDTPMNNFATMNPLDNYYQSATFSNGNNTILTDSGIYAPNTGTGGLQAGLWYWEAKMLGPTAHSLLGILGNAAMRWGEAGGWNAELGENSQEWAYYGEDGWLRNSNGSTTYGDSYTTDDIIGVYLDLNANKLYFAKNGTLQNSGTGIAITAVGSTNSGYYVPGWSFWGTGGTASFNFGNGYFGTTAISGAVADAGGEGQFKYNPSTGTFDSASKDFRAICTNNIATYGG